MSPTVVKGTNDKPAATQILIDTMLDSDLDGHLFIGYPIIGSADGKKTLDATYVSPTRGIIVFDLVEGRDAADFSERQDDAANKLFSRLITNSRLVSRRELKLPLSTVTFAPGVPRARPEGGYPVCDAAALVPFLRSLAWANQDEEVFKAALSAIQSISTIRRSRQKRLVDRPDSRGAKLKTLEESIATLDNHQSEAVIETVDAVQRIRGLAGSGKTIVLALKAAYLHAQHPDWRIAVTFNTRSLKEYFRRLITGFSLEQVGEEPDWERLRVVNAWGAPGGPERDGIYHEFCERHGIEYLDFRSAKSKFGFSDAFSGSVKAALNSVEGFKALYDAILVDEAQDLPPEFLRMCFELLGPDRRLVYAYDELQDLHGEGLPPAEEIFGVDDAGSSRVTFPQDGQEVARRDIILEKCYRNSRPVLITAHALGFGTYREPDADEEVGLVQMFDEPQLWRDIGYRVRRGELAPGKRVQLERTEETSPPFLENHSPVDDLIQFRVFDSKDEQDDWIAQQISHNLEEDELRHDDLVVINTDPLTTRDNLGAIRKRLFELNIASHLAGVEGDPDVFFREGTESVTFTGIHRAKGNEAGMVYIANAHECHSRLRNLARVRNRLFTAITRSKAWVRVAGVGPEMAELTREFEEVIAKEFTLDFRYPTPAQQEHLRIVHRDMSREEQKDLERKERTLVELLEDLRQGKVFPQDLDPELRAALVRMLADQDE